MDIGVGIGIAGVSVSAAAVLITVVKTRGANTESRERVCAVHHTIERTLESIWQAVGIIQEDIKALLRRPS